ncbi:putative sulfate exporter family transporter [Halorubellus sp. PRR65]|uniref:YeiH family protein n=1 Tax=Halorubellus sp. PRR65 TaxID=3098148 RepID=UPI002B2578D7|nr:putative sulfate exporter family transporter [Halorubellus sp. PRR65]
MPVASELVVAVALGLLVTNTVGVPDPLAPGVRTHTRWLEAGIVLMGARVSLSTLLSTGPTLAALVVGVVVLTLVLVECLANAVFGVRGKLGSLLAAGASVCGVSAAVGVAGSIDANEDDLAYAAGTILLFDVAMLFAYPVVGSALGLTERTFGVWAGLTMFSTGPVTAAGFAFGDVAGRWATVTKLTRNLLLGVLVVAYSLRYANADTERDGDRVETTGIAGSVRAIWASFPTFVLGFFAVVVLTSTGLVPDAATATMERAYKALFLVAFAGLGLSVDVDDLRSTGGTPIALVLTALLATSGLALLAVQALLSP